MYNGTLAESLRQTEELHSIVLLLCVDLRKNIAVIVIEVFRYMQGVRFNQSNTCCEACHSVGGLAAKVRSKKSTLTLFHVTGTQRRFMSLQSLVYARYTPLVHRQSNNQVVEADASHTNRYALTGFLNSGIEKS